MSLRLLLIDDDARLAELLIGYLAPHDVTLVHAAGGLAGLALASGDVDAILLDVMMPAPDGLEVLRRLRAAPATARVPVIMLTARGDEAQYSTCGVCVLLVANVSPAVAAARAPDDPDADYLATAGTVEIISVDPTFEVRLHDLEFTRVDIDDSTYQSTPTADGCASVLPEATVTTASDPFPGLALRGAARRR